MLETTIWDISLASGLSGKHTKIQATTFLHVAGTEALKIYNTFTWESDDDKSKVGKITEKFDKYCNPHKNITRKTHKFNTRNQQVGKTINQYVTDLKTKAQTCEFANLKDGLIHDRIICGIICDRTWARLFTDSELTLQKALDICRANEATASQLKTLSSGATSREIVDQEVFADPHLNHEKAKMTNVVFNTNIIRTVQFMVWSATTVGKRTIFPKFVEVDPFQCNIAKFTVLHMMNLTNHSDNLL